MGAGIPFQQHGALQLSRAAPLETGAEEAWSLSTASNSIPSRGNVIRAFPQVEGIMNLLVRGIAAAVTATLLIVSSAPALADNNEPNRGRYAALGDSFAAGVGLDDRAEAYPVLLAGAQNKVNWLAVSGATTATATQQARQLKPSVRQVTITVGGNDLNFVDVVTACIVPGPVCDAALPTQSDLLALTANLSQLLDETRARAPRAQIFVTGYPELFQPDGATCTTLEYAQFPYEPAQLMLADAVAVGVNALIGGAVLAAQDPMITFVDVTDEFEGLGMCNPMGGIAPPQVLPDGTFGPASLHPNQVGQRLYAEALVEDGFVTSALG